MRYLGAILFALFFLFMGRDAWVFVGKCIESISHWIAVNQPTSYWVVGFVGGCALLSFLIVLRWPRRDDYIDPLIQYRREHDMDT